ncbi:MAG: ATPase [Legionellales bacterium RIFCSPHIGHO2_12_FULL_42_9]|nr:MAG: ATPase [Legionellales bacterium RIFCSPHIGHO2_12_FULL_42_9]
MLFKRWLDLPDLLKKKSHFLFGPRSTGKTFLIRSQFPQGTAILDLLESELYLRLSTNPGDLESIILAFNHPSIAIIDEVQRVPHLLNEVHRLIEKKGIKFLLTGSSARKLRHNQANLLAGRARQAELFPLTYIEIPEFNLDRYLHFGGLPMVYQSDEPNDDLHAYVDTYLKEEIQAEALVRQLPAFTRFLKHSALTSGEMLNFANISNDAAVPASTVREYYNILEDTFIGFMLPAYTKTIKRKPISTAKFYYFDVGVKNTLSGITSIPNQSDLYGKSFEHFIALELRAYLSYKRKHLPLTYWQSKNGQEVDFIIGDDIAIEVKTTNHTQDKHLKSLKALEEEKLCKRYILISHDKLKRRSGNLEIMHWQEFLTELWSDMIL